MSLKWVLLPRREACLLLFTARITEKRIFYYSALSRRKIVSKQPFSINGSCSDACFHSLFLTTDLHVAVYSENSFGIRRQYHTSFPRESIFACTLSSRCGKCFRQFVGINSVLVSISKGGNLKVKLVSVTGPKSLNIHRIHVSDHLSCLI